MDDQIHREGNPLPSDDSGQFQLARMRLGAGNPVGARFSGVLETQLDVVETKARSRSLRSVADSGSGE